MPRAWDEFRPPPALTRAAPYAAATPGAATETALDRERPRLDRLTVQALARLDELDPF